MILTRRIVKVGNSAGVVLPREWLNGIAKIELIRKPLDIKKDVFEIIDPYLEQVLGVYLTGSYARGEESERSDVDVLVITDNLNKKIENGRYNIILASENELINQVKKNAFPLIPMIAEAKTLLNNKLIKDISEKYKINRDNVKPVVELTKSAQNINKSFLALDKELSSKTSSTIAYSLVLNLRSLYIINCLRKNKKWSSKELKLIIKKVSGSLKLYEGYLRVKSGEKAKDDILIEEAENLYSYIENEIYEVEKWLKEKKG